MNTVTLGQGMELAFAMLSDAGAMASIAPYEITIVVTSGGFAIRGRGASANGEATFGSFVAFHTIKANGANPLQEAIQAVVREIGAAISGLAQ